MYKEANQKDSAKLNLNLGVLLSFFEFYNLSKSHTKLFVLRNMFSHLLTA